MIYAKRKIVPYKTPSDNWGDSEFAQDLKKKLDTPKCRMYSGRRMFMLTNKSKIRQIMQAAKFPANFYTNPTTPTVK